MIGPKPERQLIKSVTEKSGRKFVAGSEVAGRPGVVVRKIERYGNFVTVIFAREGAVLKELAALAANVPSPIILHVNDVRHEVALTE